MIERIFTRSTIGGSSHEHQSIRVVASAGIEGDRYFDKHEEPGQNITLIEAEAIERFAAEHDRSIEPSTTGRNLVTRGVRLNAFVGTEFTVGSVRLRGVELCEPCLGFGEALSSAEHGPSQVVKAFVHKAGLRADVLSTGEVCVGAVVASAA
jgi:MOSC domain-containing protein YiiM